MIAAVRSGADAVYLGAKDFSARAGADNFDFEQLKDAVGYCHVRAVKVYLTLNTIVFDDELEQVGQTIVSAAKAGVDALIVQNLGVAYLAKKLVPQLKLHASTQMSVHSPSGAKLLWELGFKRVVLARELSRDEIAEIARACPEIELEVFVHGALCMSVSGQCYFSALIGSRSGNRGRCAQTCRLPFSVGGKNGYALSLKDNSVIDYIPELEKLGVVSAKIEGRLKRPEYVSAAVRACSQARDGGFVDDETRKQLESVFSRTGFTDGYYTSKRGYEMFGYRQKEDVVAATSALLSQIRNSYKDERQSVAVSAFFSAKIGEKATLRLSCEDDEVEVFSETPCEKALSRAVGEELVRKQLEKTGGTPYFLSDISTDIEEGLSLPVSALNKMRREAVEKLSAMRADKIKYEIKEYKPKKFLPHTAKEKYHYARFADTKIGKGFKTARLCFVPADAPEGEIKNLIERGFRLGAEIPRALFSREDMVKNDLRKLKSLGIEDALCNNLAAVYIARELGMRIHGGFGLNFSNTLDLMIAESLGFADTEVSFELKLDQIERLGGDLPRGIVGYGYLPVMLTRNCPNKSLNIRCSDCKRQGKMKDRLGKTFIFRCDGYATEIFNTLPADALDDFEKSRGIDFCSFRFSVENYVEKVESFPDSIGLWLDSSEKTHGLYFRGVK